MMHRFLFMCNLVVVWCLVSGVRLSLSDLLSDSLAVDVCRVPWRSCFSSDELCI